jgi:hypothetical protein
MARIRSVKPELCTSETMALLTAEEERTFVRLWTHCDDEGRSRNNPRLIKAAILPLHDDITPDDITDHISRLEDLGLVLIYEVDEVSYLLIPSWHEHQHPQRRQPSKFPPPCHQDVLAYMSRFSTRLLADTYAPVVVEGEVDGEGEVEVVGAPAVRRTKAQADAEFDRFWDAYPRREGKKGARTKFDAAVKSGVEPEHLIAAAGAYRDLPGRDPKFTKHATTWLNNGCWDDELVPRTEGTVVDRNRQGMRDALVTPQASFKERMAAAAAVGSGAQGELGAGR